MKQNGSPRDVRECIQELFEQNHTIVVGGQQRICSVEKANHGLTLASALPHGAAIESEHLKWVLLTPAVYPHLEANPAQGISEHPGGWLPNWVVPCDGFTVKQGVKTVEVAKGQVLLKAAQPRNGQGRDRWREQIRGAEFLNCRLVAARIPKLVVLTGWTEALHLKDTELTRPHGPRATLLAVPAGAVYYFKGPDAARLSHVLNWHGDTSDRDFGQTIKNRRSTLMGEKGFGLGVCGPWQFFGEK
jgi:CRISPR-associated protein Cmr3